MRVRFEKRRNKRPGIPTEKCAAEKAGHPDWKWGVGGVGGVRGGNGSEYKIVREVFLHTILATVEVKLQRMPHFLMKSMQLFDECQTQQVSSF